MGRLPDALLLAAFKVSVPSTVGSGTFNAGWEIRAQIICAAGILEVQNSRYQDPVPHRPEGNGALPLKPVMDPPACAVYLRISFEIQITRFYHLNIVDPGKNRCGRPCRSRA
jgi:hypothetical protein